MTAPPTARQCGRCRESFAIEASTEADPTPKWWLCEPCRLAFFGAHPRFGPLTRAESTDR